MSEKLMKTPLPPGGMGCRAFDHREIEAVTNVLQPSQFLFRYNDEGQCVAFERELCERLGVHGALMVQSGTSALTCCLAAWGIGPGDEVIVPAYTYIATASAVIDAGAVPVVADIDESLALDPADVERRITPYTKAVIVVHMQGVPGRLRELRALCRRRNLRLIEDACQAVGSRYDGQYTGVASDAFAWSLNYFKVITCGEGGVFFSSDPDAFLRGVYAHDPGTPMWKSGLAQGARLAPFVQMGIRGNEIGAAIARVQLTKLEPMLTQTRALKKHLIAHLDKPVHYRLQHVDDPEGDCGISIAFIAHDKAVADRMSKRMIEQGLGIGTAHNDGFPDRHIYSYWDAILNKQAPTPAGYPWKDPAYKGNVQYSRDMCKTSLDILSRALRLGINFLMTPQHMEEIAATVNYADKHA